MERVSSKRRHALPLATLALALGLALGLAGCVRNPVTGARQFTLISESQEIQIGRENDVHMVSELGLHPDSGLQRYVQGMGERLAAVSERPHLPWTFRVVDDPVINAFALPGGYIYVTRGILAYLNSEAELAAVLGHEIGHVTARHSVSRLSTQQLARIGLGVGTLLRPDLEVVAGLAGATLQLVFLKYSRDDERQADDLGLRYMYQAGWDPREMPGVFELLEAITSEDGGGRLPEWMSTHPNPGNRRGRIMDQVAVLPGDLSGLTVNRPGYLRHLDGMVYGANPREGFFRGTQFLHPELQFQFTFPQGWTTQNQRTSVVAVNSGRDAALQITLSKESTPDAASRVFLGQGGMTAGATTRTAVNGLPAVRTDFGLQTDSGILSGVVMFVSHQGRVLQVVGYSPEARWRAAEAEVRQALNTFARLTDPATLAVEPMRLEIVTLDRDMTLEDFARTRAPGVSVEKIQMLNNLRPGALLVRGQTVKSVRGRPAI
jgi:predicted Zn-dependent protease